MSSYRGVAEAPRWMGLSSAIKTTIFNFRLTAKVLEVDKGLLFETVRFHVEGDHNNVKAFQNWIERSLNA